MPDKIGVCGLFATERPAICSAWTSSDFRQEIFTVIHLTYYEFNSIKILVVVVIGVVEMWKRQENESIRLIFFVNKNVEKGFFFST